MNEDEIRAALADVEGIYPDTVGAIVVDGSELIVTLRFGRDIERSARHRIEDAARDRLRERDGIEDVLIDVEVDGLEAPKPAAAETRSGHRHGPTADRRSLPGVRNLIAVASGKGGVGKSTVAVNLALALKAQGARVGLLDIDIYGPSVPMMLGIVDKKPGVSADQKMFRPVPAYGLSVMSIGFLVEGDAPVIWRGPIVSSVVKQFLGDVAWGELDYLVVDLPPGTGDAQLTLTQTVPLTGVIIVSTPSELALVDAVKGMQMFRKTEVPVIGLVENMSFYACPRCGHHSAIFNEGGTDRVCKEFDVQLLGRIPVDVEIQRGGDEGRPIMATQPESPQASAFAALARAVIAACP